MMKNIVKITIISESVYVSPEVAYKDKMVINNESTKYSIRPLNDKSGIAKHSWSYKTDCLLYKKYFDMLSESIECFLNREDLDCCDGRYFNIKLLKEDGTLINKKFFGSIFDDEINALLKKLVLNFEEMPPYLR